MIKNTQRAGKVFNSHKSESEMMFHTLNSVLSGLDAIIMATVPETGEILFINDRKSELFGVRNDMIGKLCYEVLHHRKERCDFCAYHQFIIEPDRIVQWEARHPGTGRAHRMTAFQIDWPDGRKAYLEYGVDITNTLHQQDILERILDTLDSYTYVTDLDTDEILFVNKKMETDFGMNHDLKGEICWKRIQPNMEKRCDFCPKHKLLKNSDKPIKTEYHNPLLDKTLSIIDRIIEWPDGRRVHMSQSIDITDIKDAWNALEKAKAASAAKSAFLANMSHEIRTPMNSILGFAELASEYYMAPKARDYLGRITESATALLQIINDILDISKIESGSVELEHIPFDLRELLAACMSIITPIAYEKNLELKFHADPSIGRRLLGDPTRLRQVLLNLLSNAVKFTETGAVKLQVTNKSFDKNSVTLRFEVEDSGIGMTPLQIAKIFEPFSQADISTTRKYGGTGLGLSITNNILGLMGSQLEINSQPGAGSKMGFEITLKSADAVNETFKMDVSTGVLAKPSFDGEVLVCEDNQTNQMLIAEHLARVGVRMEMAGNGREGVNKVLERAQNGAKPFDLILMDIYMPEMDGLEAASQIMKLRTGTPIVAMTANIMTGDRELYLTRGMDGHIGKPFTSQDLWRCLKKYLKPANFSSAKETEPGDDILQLKMKAGFVEDNKNKCREITEAIKVGDIKLAHRLAHTLKGTAGLIDKADLQAAAASVEKSLKNGQNSLTDDQMQILETELNIVLDELTAIYGEKPSKPEPQTAQLSTEKALELIEQLEPLLKSGNPECLKFIDALRAMPETGKLAGLMEEFSFGDAANTLAAIKEQMEA